MHNRHFSTRREKYVATVRIYQSQPLFSVKSAINLAVEVPDLEHASDLASVILVLRIAFWSHSQDPAPSTWKGHDV
jgi:hypothetical protein